MLCLLVRRPLRQRESGSLTVIANATRWEAEVIFHTHYHICICAHGHSHEIHAIGNYCPVNGSTYFATAAAAAWLGGGVP